MKKTKKMVFAFAALFLFVGGSGLFAMDRDGDELEELRSRLEMITDRGDLQRNMMPFVCSMCSSGQNAESLESVRGLERFMDRLFPDEIEKNLLLERVSDGVFTDRFEPKLVLEAVCELEIVYGRICPDRIIPEKFNVHKTNNIEFLKSVEHELLFILATLSDNLLRSERYFDISQAVELLEKIEKVMYELHFVHNSSCEQNAIFDKCEISDDLLICINKTHSPIGLVSSDMDKASFLKNVKRILKSDREKEEILCELIEHDNFLHSIQFLSCPGLYTEDLVDETNLRKSLNTYLLGFVDGLDSDIDNKIQLLKSRRLPVRSWSLTLYQFLFDSYSLCIVMFKLKILSRKDMAIGPREYIAPGRKYWGVLQHLLYPTIKWADNLVFEDQAVSRQNDEDERLGFVAQMQEKAGVPAHTVEMADEAKLSFWKSFGSDN